MRDEILQDILLLAVQVLVPLALGYLVAWRNAAIKKIQANMSHEEYEFAKSFIGQLVRSAEQMGLIGAIADESKVKRDWVISRAEAGLAKRGIFIDLDEIAELIEAQVFEFNKTKVKGKG